MFMVFEKVLTALVNELLLLLITELCNKLSFEKFFVINQNQMLIYGDIERNLTCNTLD